MADRRIQVGYISKAHGVAGRVIVRPTTDAPDLRFAPGSRLATDEAPPRNLEVVSAHPHGGGLMVQFAGIDDRDVAESMRGVTLSIPEDERRPLEDGEYWPEDLEGCVAVDGTGRSFGTVTGVVEGAAQDRIVVTTPDGVEVEVPFVAAIVEAVDPATGRVVIDPPAGLFPE